jgi:PKD repeat protein
MNEKIKSKIYYLLIIVIAVVLTGIITYYFIPGPEVEPRPEFILQVDAGDHYECDIGEFIKFKGLAFGGTPPYNWSWDFNGDGQTDSYDRETIYFYDNLIPSIEYANLTVRDELNQTNKSTAFVYIDVELEIGDIVFLELKQNIRDLYELIIGKELPYAVHAAIYIGNNLFIETADYSLPNNIMLEEELEKWYNNIIETYSSQKNDNEQITETDYFFNLENGVQKSHSFKLNLLYDQRGLGKVSAANYSQKIKVREFCEDQIGKPYQWVIDGLSSRANPNITDPNNTYFDWTVLDDPYIDNWYCTELIWAGYLHQQINIDSKIENDPQNRIETIYYNECRKYFNNSLIDMSRLPEWNKWQLFSGYF